jgi:hypothetical protein
MKKGCFIKIIIILTILTAAVIYIIKNYYKELILEPGKKALTGIFVDKFNDEFAFINESPGKDSLRSIIGDMLVTRMENEKEISDEGLKHFFESISYTFEDSEITLSEVEEIRKIAGLKNER